MPKPFGKSAWELFSLKEDPAEMNDLSGKHPDRLKKMIALWEQYKEDNGVLDISLDLSVVK
jgi:arylsulfatase